MSLVTRDHFRLKVLWGLMTPGGLLFMSTSLSLAFSLPCEIWGYSMQWLGALTFLEIARGSISSVIIIITVVVISFKAIV